MGEKKRKYVVPLSICFLVAYLFLASRPLETEPALSPDWTVSLDRQGHEPRSFIPPQAIPFVSTGHFGFLDEQGELYLCEERSERLSIGPFAWSRYPARAETARIIHTDTQRVVMSSLPGYPWLADGSTWILAPEQQAISLITDTGEEAWTYHFDAPITSLDAANGILMAGLLTGTVHALDHQGSVIFSFTPGASRVELVCGAKLSPDARFMGIVSGLDRQRVLLLERTGNAWKVVWHRYMDTDFRRPVQLYFLDGGRKLLHEDKEGISIVDTLRRQTHHIPLSGTLLAVTDSDNDSLYFALTGIDQTTRELTGIKNATSIFYQSRWSSDNSFLARQGRHLILGGKRTLAGVLLEEK